MRPSEFNSGMLRLARRLQRLLTDCDASEIAEFAVSLPLLMMLVVGIYDFGTAFSIKDKLNTAVREGARVASNQSSIDLTNPSPNSILAIREIIDNDLVAGHVNDCGLSTTAPVQLPPRTWTFTASCGSQNLVLTINRGFTYPVNLPPPYPVGPYTIEATQITLQYPYTWSFGRIAQIVSPSTYTNTLLTEAAVIQNLD